MCTCTRMGICLYTHISKMILEDHTRDNYVIMTAVYNELTHASTSFETESIGSRIRSSPSMFLSDLWPHFAEKDSNLKSTCIEDKESFIKNEQKIHKHFLPLKTAGCNACGFFSLGLLWKERRKKETEREEKGGRKRESITNLCTRRWAICSELLQSLEIALLSTSFSACLHAAFDRSWLVRLVFTLFFIRFNIVDGTIFLITHDWYELLIFLSISGPDRFGHTVCVCFFFSILWTEITDSVNGPY